MPTKRVSPDKRKRAYARRQLASIKNNRAADALPYTPNTPTAADEDKIVEQLRQVHKSYYLARRTRVITPTIEYLIISAYTNGLTDREMLSQLASFGYIVPQRTFYRFIKNNPDFKERCENAKLNAYIVARQSIIKRLAQDGKFALDFLTRKLPEEFNQKPENEVSVKVETNNHAPAYNPEEIAKIHAEMVKLSKQQEEEFKKSQAGTADK